MEFKMPIAAVLPATGRSEGMAVETLNLYSLDKALSARLCFY